MAMKALLQLWCYEKHSANEFSQDPVKMQILIQKVWGGT